MRKTFRSLIESNQKFVGTILQIPCPELIEIAAATGCQYIIVDNEHSPATYEQTLAMLRTADSVGLATMVRIPEVTEDSIKKVLDMGFSAIRVPTVSTAEEARQIVRYAKYPPAGERGACPFVRANRFGAVDGATCYEQANRETVIAVNIEGPEGLRNMEEIIAVPGIDVINVGRVDLSVSLGVPGQTRHPLVEKAIRDVGALAHKYGKCSGTAADTPEQAAEYRDCPGITHFLCPIPEQVLVAGYRRIFDPIREAVNEK